MSGINLGKVVIAGIVAGIVIDIGEGLANLVVFAEAMQRMAQQMGMSEPSVTDIVIFNVLGLGVGIALIWLYAAIRPRYGPGPRTAVCAALFAWAFWSLFPLLYYTVVELISPALAVGFGLWTAAELVLAGLAGGALYQEETPVPRAAA